MRSDLLAILNTSNPVLRPISTGRLPDQKNLVLAFLYLKAFAPNVALNVPNLYNKCLAMQGVTPDNMLDFQCEGFSTFFGYSSLTWEQLVATASDSINGGGRTSGGQNVVVTASNYTDLQNYALLTAAHVIADAS